MAEKMPTKQLYKDGVSKSEIQRRTKFNYCTVCKYADIENLNDDKLPKMKLNHYPVLGEYITLINEWLKGDATVPRESRGTPPREYMTVCVKNPDTHALTAALSAMFERSVSYCIRTRRLLAARTPYGHPQIDFGEFLCCDAKGK